MPAIVSAGMSRWKASVNILPRPPKPITAPTVTRLIADTAATRSPARITGTAIGSSTLMNRRRGVYPMAVAELTTAEGTAANPSATVRTSKATV